MKRLRHSKEKPHWDPEGHLWDSILYWFYWKEYRYLDRRAIKREVRAIRRNYKAKHGNKGGVS